MPQDQEQEPEKVSETLGEILPQLTPPSRKENSTDTEPSLTCRFCGAHTFGAWDVCNDQKCQKKAFIQNITASPLSAIIGCGVPGRYQEAILADFSPPIAAIRPNNQGLLISGGPGVGKTHLAVAVFASALARCIVWSSADAGPRVSAAFVNAPRFLAEIRGTFRRERGERELDVIKRYTSQKLLILDDLGAEKSSEWTSESLYVLLSARLDECVPTIVTSNLGLPELERVDPRLASRLGAMTYLVLRGVDRRLEMKED